MTRPTKVGPVTQVRPVAKVDDDDSNMNGRPLSTLEEADSEEDGEGSNKDHQHYDQDQQRRRREQLSIPCTPSHLNVPSSVDTAGCSNDSDICSRLWSNPETRSQVFKRRSAVHGLSPNTGLSIGAVM